MAAWELTRWGVTSLIAFSGLILGIRAEWRNRYSKNWITTDGRTTRFINRTGEDAIRVNIEIFGGRVSWGKRLKDHVENDGEIALIIEPESPSGFVAYRINWTRPQTGKRYRLRSKDAPSYKSVPEGENPWNESQL